MFELLTFGTLVGLALGVIIGLVVGMLFMFHATAPERDYVKFRAEGCRREG